MFRVEMLPAGRGDCLWIEYGTPGSPSRLLIDGGIGATGTFLRDRIESLPAGDRVFELLVVTHIDLDHIAGILELLRHPPLGLEFGEVWFNGRNHLPTAPGLLGVEQGEALGQILGTGGFSWNESFGNEAVMLQEDSGLPRRVLPGGMTLTLLSPTRERLDRLGAVWRKEVEGEKHPDALGHPEERWDEDGILGDGAAEIGQLASIPFTPDASIANGSSIALLASFGARRCLFAADAYAADVQRSVQCLADEEGEVRLGVDAVKLSHHGGKRNTSPELLASLACPRFLFSTDGSAYRHPHREAVARAIMHGRARGTPQLVFNYRSRENLFWAERSLRREAKYDLVYPDLERSGAVVDL